MREIIAQLDLSVQVMVDAGDPSDELDRYKQIIGGVMGEIHIEILTPIYEQYDDLMPDALR
jgi:hypothetical protein